MSVQLVKDGKDPLTAPALAYLEQLGIPANLIVRIQLDSPNGDRQLVTVTLMVDHEAMPTAPRLVPLLDVPMRDEHPRTVQDLRVAPLHRTCGNYHHMGTECPPTQAAPGPDGDTRDWPTESIPAVSHVPAVCTCGRIIVWRMTDTTGKAGIGWWAHADTGAPLDHDVVPR